MTFRDRFNLRKAAPVIISRPVDTANVHRRKPSSDSKSNKFRTQRRKSSIARAHADMMYRSLYPRFEEKQNSYPKPAIAAKQTRPSIVTASSWINSKSQQSSFQNYAIGKAHNPSDDEPHSPTTLGKTFKELPALPKWCHDEYTAQQYELVKVIETKLGIQRSHYEDQLEDDSIFADFFSYARSRQGSSNSSCTESVSCGSQSSSTPQPRLTTFDDLIRLGSIDASKEAFNQWPVRQSSKQAPMMRFGEVTYHDI